MSNNLMGEVRESLLDTLKQLKNGDKSMDVNKAKAIANVAQTLINSYTLQVRAINAMGADISPQLVQEITGVAPASRPMLPPAKANGGAPPGEGIHANDPLYRPRRQEPKR
jgi:hypothetical protein